MRIELIKRPQHSTFYAIAVAIPRASALTLIAGAIMFSLLGKNPLTRSTITSSSRSAAVERQRLAAARAGDQGRTADPDRRRPVGLLPLQQLEHRRRRPVHHGRASPARSSRSCFRSFESVDLLPLMLVLGMLGGAAYAAIPAFLKTRFNTNEILTSLMLVYVAQLFLDWLVRGPWRDPQGLQLPADRAVQPVGDPARDHAGFRPRQLGFRLRPGRRGGHAGS